METPETPSPSPENLPEPSPPTPPSAETPPPQEAAPEVKPEQPHVEPINLLALTRQEADLPVRQKTDGSVLRRTGQAGTKKSTAPKENFFKTYPTEIRILGISAVIALVFMLPRMYILHEVAPGLIKSLMKFIPQQPGTQAAFKTAGTSAGQKSLFAGFGVKPQVQEKQAAQPVATSPFSRMRLDGFAGDGFSSSAVINGEVFDAGDQVEGYQITQIQGGVVSLTKEGKQYRLNLEEGMREVKEGGAANG